MFLLLRYVRLNVRGEFIWILWKVHGTFMHRLLLINCFCRVAKIGIFVFLFFGVKNAFRFTAADHRKYVHSFCFDAGLQFATFYSAPRLMEKTRNTKLCSVYGVRSIVETIWIPCTAAQPRSHWKWLFPSSLSVGRIFLLFDFLSAVSIYPLCKRQWNKIVVAVGALLYRVQCFNFNIFQVMERTKCKLEMQQIWTEWVEKYVRM